MKVTVYFENKDGTMGGWEDVGLIKLMWWIFRGRINPYEKSARYYIRRIKTKDGDRI